MKFLQNIILNSYFQLALLISAFGYLIAYLYGAYPSTLFAVYLSIAFAFFSLAMLQEFLYVYKNKSHKYHDLAKLLAITKKIEKALESIGGVGKGMYEKAESLGDMLPSSSLRQILKIAEVRNNAMHGNPYIKEARSVFKEAKGLYREIKSYAKSDFSIFYRNYFSLDKHFFLSLFSLASKLFISLYIFSIVAKYLYAKFLLGGLIIALMISYYLAKMIIFKLNSYFALFILVLFSLLYSLYLGSDFLSFYEYLIYLQSLLFERIV